MSDAHEFSLITFQNVTKMTHPEDETDEDAGLFQRV